MMKIYTNDEGIYYFTKFYFGAKEIERQLNKMSKDDERYEALEKHMIAYREEAEFLKGEAS